MRSSCPARCRRSCPSCAWTGGASAADGRVPWRATCTRAFVPGRALSRPPGRRPAGPGAGGARERIHLGGRTHAPADRHRVLCRLKLPTPRRQSGGRDHPEHRSARGVAPGRTGRLRSDRGRVPDLQQARERSLSRSGRDPGPATLTGAGSASGMGARLAGYSAGSRVTLRVAPDARGARACPSAGARPAAAGHDSAPGPRCDS